MKAREVGGSTLHLFIRAKEADPDRLHVRRNVRPVDLQLPVAFT